MNQEIVYGPALIDFFEQHYEPGNLLSPSMTIIQQIQHDVTCFDQNRILDENIGARIRQLKNQVLLDWWTYICSTQKIPYKRISIDWADEAPPEISEDVLLEALVAQGTADKVWLNGAVDGVTCLKLRELLGIMPKSFDTYLEPDHDDGILKLGVTWELEPDSEFPFFKYMDICLRGAQAVEIKDGYLVKEKARENFVRILELFAGHQIVVTTLSDRARNNFRENGDGLQVRDLRIDLEKRFPDKEIVFDETGEKRGLRQRLVMTDVLSIDIGHGFDCYEENRTRTHTTFGVALRTH